jgi:hypothetical protein
VGVSTDPCFSASATLTLGANMSPMSAVRFIKGRIHQRRGQAELKDVLAEGASASDITRQDWRKSLQDPSAFYIDCVRYFHTRLPGELREHRSYFTKESRGFGEDAFHVMWYLLFREFKPRAFLEIGVYRGQTLSLAALLQRHFSYAGEIVGISPFSPAGDSVSKYLKSVDYYSDTLANFAHFNLPAPTLIKAFSTDDAAQRKITEGRWDCAYIDGNHEYDVVAQDWRACAAGIVPGGLIVLDDSGLSSAYRAPAFATAGHPGPSRLAGELKQSNEFHEILQVGHNRVFQKQPPK